MDVSGGCCCWVALPCLVSLVRSVGRWLVGSFGRSFSGIFIATSDGVELGRRGRVRMGLNSDRVGLFRRLERWRVVFDGSTKMRSRSVDGSWEIPLIWSVEVEEPSFYPLCRPIVAV